MKYNIQFIYLLNSNNLNQNNHNKLIFKIIIKFVNYRIKIMINNIKLNIYILINNQYLKIILNNTII